MTGPAPVAAARLRQLQALGVLSGFAAGAWLGAAEAPTKVVTLGISPRWAGLYATYETGSNRYTAPTLQPDGSSVKRNDDVKTLRGGIRGQVTRYLNIGITAEQSDYTSNLPGFDRSVFRIGTTIGFGSGGIDILK